MSSNKYNVVINSEKALNAGSNRGSLNYYIDWTSFLKEEGTYLMSVNFTSSGQILQGNYTYLLTMTGLPVQNYEITLTGGTTTSTIASLKYGASLGSQTYSYLTCSSRDNPPVYLLNRPSLSTFTIEVRNSINNGLFSDDAIAGAGTATMALGGILTVVTQTSGVILIGTIFTIVGTQYTVIGYGTGNGGTGTYFVSDKLTTIPSATAYTTSARNQLGPYNLTLSFEKI